MVEHGVLGRLQLGGGGRPPRRRGSLVRRCTATSPAATTLAELVLDACQGAADAVHAVDTRDGGRAVLHTLTGTYRAWAAAQSHLYLLIQGPRWRASPLPPRPY
ncbi:hypothetical protein [Streptomyces sp. NPDC050535]|uniref:hypothetical protein n=1 Tax=Streptomyces sp. NPDC050535 TaxID=3365626 RepID=UPI0037B5FA6D